jgi:hypothetical protein
MAKYSAGWIAAYSLMAGCGVLALMFGYRQLPASTRIGIQGAANSVKPAELNTAQRLATKSPNVANNLLNNGVSTPTKPRPVVADNDKGDELLEHEKNEGLDTIPLNEQYASWKTAVVGGSKRRKRSKGKRSSKRRKNVKSSKKK